MQQKTSTALILDGGRETRRGGGDRLRAGVAWGRAGGRRRTATRGACARPAARGVLVKPPGTGPFVARTLVITDSATRRTFWGMIEISGAKPSLSELERDEVEVEGDLAEHMRIQPGTRVAHLRWLFSANDQPVVLIDHYIGPHIRTEGIDFEKSHNLLAALADQIGAQAPELETSSTAINVAEPEAEILGLEPGLAILYGFAKVHDPEGRIAIVSYHWSNPKLFSISHRESVAMQQLRS